MKGRGISSGMLFNDSGFSQGPKPCNGAVPVLVEPTRHEVLRRRTGHRAPHRGLRCMGNLLCEGCSSNFDLIPPPRRCRNIAVWLEAVNQGDFRSERSEAAPASAWRLIPVDTCSGRGPLDDGEVRDIELRPGLF